MSKEEKWDASKSIKYLPSSIRKYFLDEARTMYHALATAEVQIVEDKSGRYKPGRYGERRFRVISTNPGWYHELYFSRKPKWKLSKKRRAELEREKIRKALAQSEREGITIDYTKKRRKRRNSFNRRVQKCLDAIVREKDITLPEDARKHQPGLLQARLREMIFERLMMGYKNFDELVPPMEDREFLRYFDAEVESGDYRGSYDNVGPDDTAEEFTSRTSEDEAPF